MRNSTHRTHARGGSTAAAPAALRALVDQALAAWEPAFDAVDSASSAWSGWAARPWEGSDRGRCKGCRDRGQGESGCGCDGDCGSGCGCGCGCDGGCGCDVGRCASSRCVGCAGCARGADVLLVAGLGERRVVPLTVRNPRRRTTTVTVTPGEWTSCTDPAPQVTTTVVPAGELVLEPCETREVLLVVTIGQRRASDQASEDRLGDVHCTTVLVSDITVEGCGESVRLAVEVRPRDCSAFEVTCCDCGC